jgi:excisionase family DNA binding protein
LEDELNKRRQRKNVRPPSPIVLLSVNEVARRYKFHPNTIRRWISEDGLKSLRYGPGSKIFVAEKDVEEFIKKFYEY